VNERNLSVAGSWSVTLVTPSADGDPVTRETLECLEPVKGRPVEVTVCEHPEPDDLALVDLAVVDLTGDVASPVDVLLDTVTVGPHIPAMVIVRRDDPDLASRALVAGAHAVVRASADDVGYREQLTSALSDLLTVSRPVLGGRRGITGPLARNNPEVFGTLVHRYAQEVQARVDLRRGAATEGLKGPRRSGLSALSAVLVELEAGPRDLTDIHVVALRSLCRDTSSSAQRQLVHDARLALVETMGRLAGRYRTQALYARSEQGEADDGALA